MVAPALKPPGPKWPPAVALPRLASLFPTTIRANAGGALHAWAMIPIAITAEAFDAIAATLPLGSICFAKPEFMQSASSLIWLKGR